jgi:hypothetical protein
MTTRTAVAVAVAAAILSFPASAAAATSTGVVLSAPRHHMVQVVDRHHVVHAYTVHGKAKKLIAGARVRYTAAGTTITHVVVTQSQVHEVSFLGRVVKLGKRSVLLKLGDAKLMRLPGKPVHLSSVGHGAVTAGAVVLVTITFGKPGSKPTVSVASSPGASGTGPGTSGAGPGTGETGTPDVAGTITELDVAAIVVQPAAGGSMRFQVAPSVLSSIQPNVCDTVEVAYHQAAGALVADTVTETNGTPIAACAGSGSSVSTSDNEQTVTGSITQETLTTLTITNASGQAQTFDASVDLTNGFLIGESVAVTYDPSSGVAWDVECNDIDAIGQVTFVDGGEIVIVNSTTGLPQTFTDDPANGSFDGINVGDQVDVSYYYSSGKVVVDSVRDLTNPN